MPHRSPFLVRLFQLKPTLPENFQEKSVERLRKAVVAIQQATPIDATLEELYQSVENLCSHGMAEKVYQALKVLVEKYVQDCVQQFLGESLDKLIFMKKMKIRSSVGPKERNRLTFFVSNLVEFK